MLLDECGITFLAYKEDYFGEANPLEGWMRDWRANIIKLTDILLKLKEYFPDCRAFDNHKELWNACIALKEGKFKMEESFFENILDKIYLTTNLYFEDFLTKSRGEKRKVLLKLDDDALGIIDTKLDSVLGTFEEELLYEIILFLINEGENIEEIAEKFTVSSWVIKEVERYKKEHDTIVNLLEEGMGTEEIATRLGVRIDFVKCLKEKKEKGLYYTSEEKKYLRYCLQCLSILLELEKQLHELSDYNDKIKSEIDFFKKHIAPKVGL